MSGNRLLRHRVVVIGAGFGGLAVVFTYDRGAHLIAADELESAER